MPLVTDHELVKTIDAADILGVSRWTLTRWVEAGKITPTVRVPGYRGAWLFERSALEEFAKQEQAA